MKRVLIAAALWIAAVVLLAACSMGAGNSSADVSGITLPGPADMPARPGLNVTGDASVNLEQRIEVAGVVKEVNGDLVLIDLAEDGGEFMLRFTENTRWNEGVEQTICAGNTVTCVVLPEETFAPPAQGEVIEVLSNTAAE